MAEAGIAHLLAALAHLRATGAAALEPSAEAQAAFVREVDRRMRGQRLDRGWLPELVPRPDRSQLGAVAGLHPAVPAAAADRCGRRTTC